MHVAALTRLGPLADPLVAAGVQLHAIGKRHKIDPAAYWRLKRLIEQLQPDLVQTWMFAANAYGRQAAFQANAQHVLASERCVDRWKTWGHWAIDRYLARRTERIVTNSSGVVEYCVAHGIDQEKFVVIPNGVPLAEPDGRSRDEVLGSLGLSPDVRLIGAVGRLWPQKRYKDLIWAADLLKVIRDDTHLVIIGDGPERERLERYCRDVAILDRVHLLGHRSDVARLMPHFNCFWLGSGYEGQSNALMEAMALGLPVVVTNIPGNRDLVEHDVTGYLVPVGDRAGFARYTQTLLEEPAVAQRLGAAARQRMREQFSVEQMVERYADLYRRTVEG